MNLSSRAVAMKYDQGNMDAPVCLANGYDDVAHKIKAIAAENSNVLEWQMGNIVDA